MKKCFPLIFCLTLFLSLLRCADTERVARSVCAKTVRLHVCADSDADEAQRLKLAVRDAVLSELSPFLSDCPDADAAAGRISALLPRAEAAARACLDENDCSLPVRASLTEERFPVRRYEGFVLPAGDYRALRVSIGSGEGKNWWCVVFPPLCLPSLEQDDGLSVFSPEERRLVSEDGYELRFRISELFSELKKIFGAK